MASLHSGHRARMINRYLKDGADSLNEHELLEILLYYTVQQKDTNPLAHELLNKFGSLSGVLDATAAQLKDFPMITDRTVCYFRLIKDVFREYSIQKSNTVQKFKSVDDIGEYLILKYGNLETEIFSLLLFNNAGKLLKMVKIQDGDLASVKVSAREIVETVIKYSAGAVIMVHNHPGGIALPSTEDLQTTAMINTVLKSINVKLIDHIIIAGEDYVSMHSSEKYKNFFV